MMRDIVVYPDEKSLKRDDLDQTEPLEIEMSNVTVPKPSLVAGRKKAKKEVAFHSALKLAKKINREYGEGSGMKRDLYSRERVSPDEDSPDQRIARQSRILNVEIPPSRPSGSSSGDSIRNKVKETLRLFYGACRKLLQEEEAKPEKDRKKRFRVDFEASKILKSKGKYLNVGIQILGSVPGIERLPISAVNETDDEEPPLFTYTVKMIYPDWCRPVSPKSCGCTKRCMEAARTCNCVSKNGGEIPYNHDGAIIGAKPLIYECGPRCKCPTSCYLRVTQHGIKFQLEIFKTESRGWGVRLLNSIPSGSFICEYVGELLEDKEAERRIGNDEYLFDIGNRYENFLAQGMSELMPGTQAGPAMEEDDETSGFTIDAATKVNIGRFINHSCSPNLYAQNVLYDHDDTRIAHMMFFAMDNIPPLQELCYHYNYALDQVRDSNGNIKKKICYCGSSECTGRLY